MTEKVPSLFLIALAPLLCSIAHITEEFVFPGGFVKWYRNYRPAYAASITPRYLLLINSILLGAGALLAWLGLSWARGPSLWLILAAILGANAYFHIRGTFITRKYSPGVITGTLLYIPLFVIGNIYFLSHHIATLGMATFSLVVGASYQFWSDTAHGARSVRA